MHEYYKKKWESGSIPNINEGGNTQDPSYIPTTGGEEAVAWIESSYMSPPIGNYHSQKRNSSLPKPKMIPYEEWKVLQEKKEQTT
jgi:hypothetical protein